MSRPARVAITVFALWVVGLPFVLGARTIEQSFRSLYLTALLWVPLAILAVVTVLAWIEQRLRSRRD